jgi:hypothetical protein
MYHIARVKSNHCGNVDNELPEKVMKGERI